ncbi:hypothetical protein AMST5_01455 [freshwater sediment metagenome]|uniref:Uncharacterized protein n=1 Tax=freshwater sediment metagenome TaxID=556182 RepID=A0AA48RCN6_9ZZZZ
MTDVAKTQTQRTNEYRARIKEERDALLVQNDALLVQNDALQRRLDEIALVSLSPVARAELDSLCAERGQTEAELIDSILVHLANNRAKVAAQKLAKKEVAEQARRDAEKVQDDYLAHMERRQRANTQPTPEESDLEDFASALAANELKDIPVIEKL